MSKTDQRMNFWRNERAGQAESKTRLYLNSVTQEKSGRWDQTHVEPLITGWPAGNHQAAGAGFPQISMFSPFF